MTGIRVELTSAVRSFSYSSRRSSNAAIASRLGVSPKTAANNLSSIFARLQVADRAAAILRAREAGLGGPDQ